MALETKLYSLLSGTTVITGTVGTRIYPVIAPQNPAFPFIVYTRITGGQQSGLSGYLTLERPRIQIDVYSTSYSQAKTVADNVHTIMDGATAFKSILISDGDLYEDDIEAYRVSMDFSCINKE